MNDSAALLREALALNHAGRHREAQLVYSRMLAEDPENAEALHLSGLVAFRESRFDDAIALLRRAVASAPGNALYLGNLGNVLKDSGRRDDAIAIYERALALDPDQISALNNLGVMHLEGGKPEDAIREFRDVVARKPDHVHAHFNLGNALFRSGNVEAAERAYRRTLALNPDFAEALAKLASLLQTLNRDDEALVLLRRRAIVDPESVHAHADLARALERHGELESALASYQNALALAPDALDVRCSFCALLQMMCDWERLALHVRDVLQALAQGRAGVPPDLLVSLHTLADEACHIELDVLEKGIGKQDQFMAAYGGLTVLDIAKDGKVDVRVATYGYWALGTRIKPRPLGSVILDGNQAEAYRREISDKPLLQRYQMKSARLRWTASAPSSRAELCMMPAERRISTTPRPAWAKGLARCGADPAPGGRSSLARSAPLRRTQSTPVEAEADRRSSEEPTPSSLLLSPHSRFCSAHFRPLGRTDFRSPMG